MSHWPDRSEPFSYANSECIRFIELLGASRAEAIAVWSACRKGKGVIKFDQDTQLWAGTGDTSKLRRKTQKFHKPEAK